MKNLADISSCAADLRLQAEAWRIASGMVPGSLAVHCNRIGDNIEVTAFMIDSAVSDLQAILDDCRHQFPEDREAPGNGGAE